MTPPPKIHTYHCICTSLLLASTHKLSTLPTRQSPSKELILPLPSSTPLSSEEDNALPPEGYSIILGLDKAPKPTIIRREDGFEKRMLYRCTRCRVVVAYELMQEVNAMEVDGKGNDTRDYAYTGKVIYLLPGGVMSTEVMMAGRKIGEEDVDVGRGIAGFE